MPNKLWPVTDGTKQITGYYFPCPGCGDGHAIAVSPHKNAHGASWQLSGTLERPTITPSIDDRWHPSDPARQSRVCHFLVTDGKIRFISDSTHPLSGQEAEMLDIDEHKRRFAKMES